MAVGRETAARCGTGRRPRHPAATAAGTSAGLAHVGQQRDRVRRRRSGPGRSEHVVAAASQASGSSAGVGLDDDPGRARIDQHNRAVGEIGRRRRSRRRPGCPRDRASTAVWLVGPPSAVTSASTVVRSRPAVSAGARSRATSTNGWPGSGTPGTGDAEAGRDRPLADVVEVGDPLGQVGPGRGQRLAEPGERLEHRPGRGRATGSLPAAIASSRAGSSAISACASSTSRPPRRRPPRRAPAGSRPRRSSAARARAELDIGRSRSSGAVDGSGSGGGHLHDRAGDRPLPPDARCRVQLVGGAGRSGAASAASPASMAASPSSDPSAPSPSAESTDLVAVRARRARAPRGCCGASTSAPPDLADPDRHARMRPPP